MNKEQIEQAFDNNSDCYADTWRQVGHILNSGLKEMKEGAVVPAMTKAKFVELWQQSQSVEQPEVHQLTGITELDNLLAEYSKNKWSIDVLTGRVWNMAYRAGQLSTPTPEMKWVSEKPKADHECILLTASYYDGWNYNSFEIQHTRGVNENGDDAWYFGIYDLDGSEWGAYDDIEADLYCTVEIPAPPLNPQDK